MDMLEIAKLLVEMSRQQQRAVVQLALGDLKGALAGRRPTSSSNPPGAR
jgi:hypothetical protein